MSEPTALDPRRADPADWQDSGDIETAPGNWVPRYFRCTNPRCLCLVTHGQVRLGGCGACGMPRLMAAGRLDAEEVLGLKAGDYPLTAAEAALIQPLKDCVVTSIVEPE